jgi:hypothetical protein
VSATGKLAAFAVAVAAAFGLGYGLGDLAGPFDERDDKPAVHDEHGWGSDEQPDQ